MKKKYSLLAFLPVGVAYYIYKFIHENPKFIYQKRERYLGYLTGIAFEIGRASSCLIIGSIDIGIGTGLYLGSSACIAVPLYYRPTAIKKELESTDEIMQKIIGD